MGPWREGDIVGFDLETTGVSRSLDVPVSFALVQARRGTVVRRVAALVDPGRDIPAEAAAIHGITTERARRHGMPLDEAMATVLSELSAASAAGIPVGGMRLDFDLTITDTLCRALGGRGLAEHGWQGPALDASVLDRRFDRARVGRRTLGDLCRHYGVSIERPHEASADAEAAVAVLRAMSLRYPALHHASVHALHQLQSGWHRAWATDYSTWRQGQGLEPLAPDELQWPIAGWHPPVAAVA